MKEFEEIYRENYAAVYGFLRKLCADRDLAEDLTGDTFYEAFRSFRKFRGDSRISTWLTAIAKHVYSQYLRRHRLPAEAISIDTVEEFFYDDLYAPSAAPEDGLLNREMHAGLRRAVGRMPQKYRDVVMLRIYAELPFAEVAAALNITENSAKVIFCRAKKMLSEDLKHEFDL